MEKNVLKSKLTYNDFVNFMKRYERENKKKTIKETSKNPYKYIKVFNKGNK